MLTRQESVVGQEQRGRNSQEPPSAEACLEMIRATVAEMMPMEPGSRTFGAALTRLDEQVTRLRAAHVTAYTG